MSIWDTFACSENLQHKDNANMIAKKGSTILAKQTNLYLLDLSSNTVLATSAHIHQNHSSSGANGKGTTAWGPGHTAHRPS